MGIDIYLEWDNMPEEDRKAQATGFSITSGNVGYLREAYHGGPYATRILVREAFEANNCKAPIPAAIMRERLTSLTEPDYGATGGHKLAAAVVELFNSMNAQDDNHTFVRADTTRPMSVEEAVRERMRRLYPDSTPEFVNEVVESFRSFVALAEEKENKTGKPCTVLASY